MEKRGHAHPSLGGPPLCWRGPVQLGRFKAGRGPNSFDFTRVSALEAYDTESEVSAAPALRSGVLVSRYVEPNGGFLPDKNRSLVRARLQMSFPRDFGN
jgi:hypothetical protein